MSYSHDPSFDDFQRRWYPVESHTSLISILLALVVGAYSLFKTLDLLGFPVWLWTHQLLHMSSEVLRLCGVPLNQTSDPDTSNDMAQRSGGLLGNLFGLNPASLLQKGVRGVAGALSRNPNGRPAGLGNISNSCYQNSVIQGLASLPSLRTYLSNITTEHPSLNTDTMNGALFDMISKLLDPTNQGQAFWIRGKLKSMSVFQQQDAQEYYSKVLDALEEEVKKTSSSNRRSSVSWLEATKGLGELPKAANGPRTDENDSTKTTVGQPKITPNPLDGLLAQRVGCVSCGYSEGLSLIPFNCVTVSLGQNDYYSITECLDDYTTLEYIDGVECAKCTLLKLKNTLTPLATAKPDSPFAVKLNAVQEALDEEDFEDKTLIKTFNIAKKNWVQSTKSKQLVVARAPKSLVLHVNRSSFNENTGVSYKNTARVSYPPTLNFGKWCLGSTPSGSQHPDMSLEEWPRDPKESMLAEVQDDKSITSPFQYALRAAVTHYGSHGNGHYVCYRQHPNPVQPPLSENIDPEVDAEEAPERSGERWWRFSDDSVFAIREEEAHQGNVFMLFYERLDEVTSLSPQEDLSAPETLATPEDAPLPPTNVSVDHEVIDNEGVDVPLPDEDDDLEPNPYERQRQRQPPAELPAQDVVSPSVLAEPTPSVPNLSRPSRMNDAELDIDTSEAESEDAPSTQFTSDYDSDVDTPAPPTPKAQPIPPVSPHLMRTAGNATTRGQGSRQSLPLVSAT